MQSLMTVLRWDVEILKHQGGWDIKFCVSHKFLSEIDTNEIGNLVHESEMLEQEIFQSLEGERQEEILTWVPLSDKNIDCDFKI